MFIRTVFFVLMVGLLSSCGAKYTVKTSPVNHTFEKKDGPKALLDIVPVLFAAEGKEDGVYFFRMTFGDDEETYFKDFFKNFERDYSLKKTGQDKGRIMLVYGNNACKKEMEDCVDHILVSYGPPKGFIESCKLDKTHIETGEKSVIYESMSFPFYINYQLRGSDQYKSFATVMWIRMTDFDKYQKVIQHIQSVYPQFEVKCK